MNTKLVRIGNSKGVRIPKAIIEQAGLDKGKLELEVIGGSVVISAPVRAGWEEAAKLCHERGDDQLPGWEDTNSDFHGEW